MPHFGQFGFESQYQYQSREAEPILIRTACCYIFKMQSKNESNAFPKYPKLIILQSDLSEIIG